MRIFLTGASGFIGGTIAARLVEEGHVVRGLVRDPAKAEALRARGIEPVLGDLAALDLLAAEAGAADAVVNAASSDARPAVEALVRGLAGSGKPLLHTSGTSIVCDHAAGEPSDRVFDEATPFTPPPERVERVALDRFLVEAAGQGVRTVVLCNSLIYGRGLGLHTDSVQLPALRDQAAESGIARHIGRGLNIWSTVHVLDMADLYLLALERAPAGSFLFVESGEASFRDMVTAIARRLGLGAPESWPLADAIRRWGHGTATLALGSNSRVRAVKARALGWRPRQQPVLDWIDAGGLEGAEAAI